MAVLFSDKAGTFPLSGAGNEGGVGRGRKQKTHAIYKQRVCFNAPNKWDLASLLQQHLP